MNQIKTLWHRLWKSCRLFFNKPRRLADLPDCLKNTDLSALKTDQQLVLVCGDSGLFFADKASVHVTHCGGYLNTPTLEAFTQTIKWIAAERPLKLRHLSVMFCVAPEYHYDEEKLRAALCQWRHCFFDSRHQINAALPVMLYVCVNQQSKRDPSADSPLPATWFVHDGFLKGISSDSKVYRDKCATVKFAVWQKEHPGKTESFETESFETESFETESFAQALWLNRLLGWLGHVVISELQPQQTHLPFTLLGAVAIHFTALNVVENNIWQRAIYQDTALYRSNKDFHAPTLAFPDLVLPLILPPRQFTSYQTLSLKSAGMLVAGLTIMMMMSSCNNKQLIRDFASDIQAYKKLGPDPVESKLHAQNQLIYNQELLNRFQHYGVPLHLDFGLYQGRSLYMPLQRAINDWTAPTAFYTPAQPHSDSGCQRKFRFPNSSLFNPGESRINAEGLPALQKVLLKIRVESYEKIQITGHTDSSGDKQQNQQLSLKRAESVRDWMIIQGNFPRDSFIVQGMGASQSIKYNDTAEGRAANRRIDIDLVR